MSPLLPIMNLPNLQMYRNVWKAQKVSHKMFQLLFKNIVKRFFVDNVQINQRKSSQSDPVRPAGISQPLSIEPAKSPGLQNQCKWPITSKVSLLINYSKLRKYYHQKLDAYRPSQIRSIAPISCDTIVFECDGQPARDSIREKKISVTVSKKEI